MSIVLTLGHINGIQKNGKQNINSIIVLIHVHPPSWFIVRVGPVDEQYGQVYETGRAPKSRRIAMEVGAAEAGFVVGVDAEAAGCGALFPPPGCVNSVVVTCLPSGYVVVTVFETIPGGTATFGGGRGGTDEVPGTALRPKGF